MNTEKSLKVKLIHCGNRSLINQRNYAEKYVFYMPMGIFSLAAELKKNGIEVEILHSDLLPEHYLSQMLETEAPDAIGFDLHWVNQGLNVLETTHHIKEVKPEIHIFLGGYTASYFAREILEQYPWIDSIIRGDAEEPIIELCQVLQQEKQQPGIQPSSLAKMKSVQNLVWRKGQEIQYNQHTYVSDTQQMNRFDFAEIQLLRGWEHYRDLSRYWTRFKPLKERPLFFLEIGRGCPYNCTICGGNAQAQMTLNQRRGQAIRTVDSVIATIKKAMTHGFSNFFTCFDFENCQYWYNQLCERVKKENLRISLSHETWSLPYREMIDAMACSFDNVMIAISPDTADENLRKANKDPRLYYSNQHLEECVEYLATKKNVKVQLWFGYFLPGDTEETIFRTMSYISELVFRYPESLEITYMNINTDPGSALYCDPGQLGIQLEVITFQDYIQEAEKRYQENQGKAMMHLSRPKGISDPEAVNLGNKILLFNRILRFRQTSSKIMEKSLGNNPIVDYLKNIDMTHAGEKDFTREKVKEILKYIQEEHLPDSKGIITLLEEEALRLLKDWNQESNSFFISREKEIEPTRVQLNLGDIHQFNEGFEFEKR
jgi:radical SAM superfamily enzyme YgiQ (UPF0313 family)